MKKILILILFVLVASGCFYFGHYFIQAKKYYDIINKYCSMYTVEPSLIQAIIKVESNFNVNAKSKKGATGLMQIMPSTAKEIASVFKIENFDAEKLYDQETNIMFGTYYCYYLLNIFDNNLNLALAAYNAGLGNVQQWKQSNNKIEYDAEHIPFKETKKFVRKIKFSYFIFKTIEKMQSIFNV
ncbi:lytic transglycosylase domain-containing protein [Candidatus Ruminimicrobium bovinum]|uniref:lytic transglycosylase domain-containing protein n=1 Tax=Candidatus Ruminimicrobium bovinum TaxID=3242779 RepID=UPI0039B8E02E